MSFPNLYDLPFVLYYQDYSVSEVVFKGILDGYYVLDLGCAEGHYTRMLRRKGASKVVGIDGSQVSINIAKELEQEDQLDIENHSTQILVRLVLSYT